LQNNKKAAGFSAVIQLIYSPNPAYTAEVSTSMGEPPVAKANPIKSPRITPPRNNLPTDCSAITAYITGGILISTRPSPDVSATDLIEAHTDLKVERKMNLGDTSYCKILF
jgi:hypothetical protein